MRRLSLILATALVTLAATPLPAMADRNSDAAVGAILGVMVAAAIAKNRGNSRFNYATDTVFYPATLPGVMCYSRARQCYFRGHYSAAATRDVFQ
jgi:hypothetical protein